MDGRLITLLEVLLQGVLAKAHFVNRARSIERLNALRRTSNSNEKSMMLNELLVELTTYTGELMKP